MAIDFVQHRAAQVVRLQQGTEAPDGGLIRRRSHSRIDYDKLPLPAFG